MDIIEIINKFGTQEHCVQHLEKLRWGNIPECPYCKSCFSSPQPKELRHKCLDCNRSFSVLIGTIFESTKLSLTKWFLAIYLIMDAKKGISSLQLSRHLKVNKDTALFLQRRIRSTMNESNILNGVIEIDETYIGGSMTKMKENYKKEKGLVNSGMEHKKPVLGMYEKEGKVILKTLNKAWGKEIKPIIFESVTPESIIITDGFGAYYGLDNMYKEHIKLNHERKIFSKGEFNTSKIEGFWSMLKRAIIGTYHKVSSKYLQEYLNEIAFKFNYKSVQDKMNFLINRIFIEALPYSG